MLAESRKSINTYSHRGNERGGGGREEVRVFTAGVLFRGDYVFVCDIVVYLRGDHVFVCAIVVYLRGDYVFVCDIVVYLYIP